MKQFYISLILLLTVLDIQAQLLTPYTLYRDQWGVLNPAAISNNYVLDELSFSVSAMDRHQWLGNGFNWDYSPNTQIVNFEGVIEHNNIAIGGNLHHDRTGDLSSMGGYARFAYLISMDRFAKKTLSIGLAAGLLQNRSRIDGSNQDYFRTPEQEVMPSSVIKPDVSLGIFYYHEDLWYAGFSIPQLLSLNTQFGEDQIAYSIKQPRHYYFLAGGYIPSKYLGIGDGSSFLEVSGWARYLPIRQSEEDSFAHIFRIDLNARYQHNQSVWLGIGFGTDLATEMLTLHTELGLLGSEQFNLSNGQLKVGLAMDHPVGGGLHRLGPSAEIIVMYSWQ